MSIPEWLTPEHRAQLEAIQQRGRDELAEIDRRVAEAREARLTLMSRRARRRYLRAEAAAREP